MELRFQNKTAIVTGSSRGIGAATAKRLASEGANVVVNYVNNPEAAQKVAAEINEGPGRAIVVQGNVGEYDEFEALVAACVAQFGGVDILVNNAGMSKLGTLMEMPLEDWHAARKINFDGPFYGCRLCAPHMIKAGGGTIVNVGSLAMRSGGGTSPAYSAGKSALSAFTVLVAKALAPHNIRVNVVAPGMTDTDLQASLGPGRMGGGSFEEIIKKQIPLGHLADPKEIASAIAFFCSEDSSYITGETIFVAGGKL